MNTLPNIDDLVAIIDDDIKDDDYELDLVKLVSTNANDENQYLLFQGSDNQYYAINVSKIEELFVYKELDIVHNNDKDSYILGTANIRKKMTSVVSFDKWMGNPVLDDEHYELVIIAAYGGRRFAIVVKDVEYIVTIESHNMTDNSENNSKASFISQVTINTEEKLCTIFDSDMLLLEVFDKYQQQSNIELESLTISAPDKSEKTDKTILFADDSRLIREMVEKLFVKLQYNYIIYPDGIELIKQLPQLDPQKIALIITDLEMPGASGREVITYIRANACYDPVNIIVHSNMSNNYSIEKGFSNKRVAKIIEKIDMNALAKAIEEFII